MCCKLLRTLANVLANSYESVANPFESIANSRESLRTWSRTHTNPLRILANLSRTLANSIANSRESVANPRESVRESSRIRRESAANPPRIRRESSRIRRIFANGYCYARPWHMLALGLFGLALASLVLDGRQLSQHRGPRVPHPRAKMGAQHEQRWSQVRSCLGSRIGHLLGDDSM